MAPETTGSGSTFEGLVARTEGLQPWRRVAHAATGVVFALGPGWMGWAPGRVVAVLGGVTALAFAMDAARLTVPRLNRLFFVTFRWLASPREARAVASSTWYALAATLVWLGAPGTPAVSGLLVLGLADPAASVIGRRWGRSPLGKGTREGSGAFFAVALLVLWSRVDFPAALFVAALVALVEIVPSKADDNLTVPIATAALVTLAMAASFA